ncbi:hypothetical protein G6F61_014502 [Rhizopus arrhizus]|nr:hypothetical protein G6F61_014502 [Rhizopus arrhizus]
MPRAAASRADRAHPAWAACSVAAVACSPRPPRRTMCSARRIRCWQDRCHPSAQTAWGTAPTAPRVSAPARCSATAARGRRPIAWPAAPA